MDLKALFRRSTAPKELLGRDAEKKTIQDFLATHLQAKRGGSLYISGCPGSGKTAVFDEALAQILQGKVRSFVCFVLLNSDTNNFATPHVQPIEVKKINCASAQNKKDLQAYQPTRLSLIFSFLYFFFFFSFQTY